MKKTFDVKRLTTLALLTTIALTIFVVESAIPTLVPIPGVNSVSGGFLCLIVMAAVNKLLRGQYIFLTGILGAVSHNAGQILAAFFILRLSGIFAYMPFLVISGVITGLFTGLVCFFADRYIPKKYTM